MKKIFLLIVASFLSVSSIFAADDVEVTLKPGKANNELYVDFSLKGVKQYTLFQANKITLPAGFELEDFSVRLGSDGILPYTESHGYTTYKHYVSSSDKQTDGSYILLLESNNNDVFTSTEGKFLRMYVKCDNTKVSEPSTLKVEDMFFVDADGNKSNHTDATCDLGVLTGISNVVASETINSDEIYTVSGIKVTKMQKNHLYIVGGKKVLNK